jgi:hypothetical protein
VNGSGLFLPANYLLIPRGTNGSGAFLLATYLLVPCPTVCGARRNQDSCPVTNKNDVPDAAMDLMPSKCGAWIPTTAGYRRLYADELAKGLGVPSTWLEEGRCGLKARHLNNLDGIHLWEAVGLSAIKFFRENLKPAPQPMGPEASPVKADIRSPTGDLHLGESPKNSRPVDSDSSHQHRFVSEDTGWSWEAPNLNYNGTWYKQRIRTIGEVQGLNPDAPATFPGRLPIRDRLSRTTPRAGVGQYYY